MKQLHSILKDIALFLCVTLPVVYCVGLAILIYTVGQDCAIVSYYVIKLIAITTIVTCLCVLATKGLGLHLNKRR